MSEYGTYDEPVLVKWHEEGNVAQQFERLAVTKKAPVDVQGTPEGDPCWGVPTTKKLSPSWGVSWRESGGRIPSGSSNN